MFGLLHDALARSASATPAKEALVHGTERLSYTQVEQRVARLAAALQRGGVGRGDRVAIYLDVSLPQALSIYAVARAGAVFVPIHRQLFPDQVQHILNDCAASCLITDATKLDGLGLTLAEVPSLQRLVVVGDAPAGRLPSDDYDALLARPGTPVTERSISKDLAAILYTSGSTGKPKGVVLSHANITAGGAIVSRYLGLDAAERILALLPLSFDAGLNQLVSAFHVGATCVLGDFLTSGDIVDLLQTERITGLAGVPTLWSLLTAPDSALHGATLPQLRYVTNTGGAMPQRALATLRAALPSTKVFLMYGLTEAFRSTYLPPEEVDRRPTSIGKAIPDTEILVINAEGKPCAPGETGELVHRGPTVALGYWGHPQLTRERLRPHPLHHPALCTEELVCYSGDLVRADEDGFLYFVGRRDAMIKSMGFRVSPTEIEAVLCHSGQVLHAAAIGVPDELAGQVIKAFVIPKRGTSPTSAGLIAHCKEHSPNYMVPRMIELVDELPKLSNGKVDYGALRTLAKH